MANAYGTPAYTERFRSLSADTNGEHEILALSSYRDYRAEGDCYSSFDGKYGYDSTLLSIYKGDRLIYRCLCNEERGYRLPCFYTENGEDFALFRRDLYGYTILNLNTLAEYNYFPDKIFKGEEAFIICEAYPFRDILLLCGCYWAGPYHCRLLDAKTFRTYNLSEDMKNADIEDDGLSIEGDEVIFTCSNGKRYGFLYGDLKRKLQESENRDL